MKSHGVRNWLLGTLMGLLIGFFFALWVHPDKPKNLVFIGESRLTITVNHKGDSIQAVVVPIEYNQADSAEIEPQIYAALLNWENGHYPYKVKERVNWGNSFSFHMDTIFVVNPVYRVEKLIIEGE